MRICKFLLLFPTVAGILLLGEQTALPAGDKDKPAKQGVLIVTDGNGKEHKVKVWKFTAGTKYLSWLAAAPKEDKEKDKDQEKTPVKGKKGGKVGPKANTAVGPEALEFSAVLGVPLKKRILTYVLLENIRSLEFDSKKETVTLRIAKSDKMEDDEVLVGVIGYENTNIISIDAEADLGEFGLAEMKFKGGVRGGIKAIRFPAPKPLPAEAKGRFAEVIGVGKTKDSHKVVDLQPLYLQANGLEQVVPTLYFQKTVKLDVTKIAQLAQVGMGGSTWDVTLKSGDSQPLGLIERPTEAGAKYSSQLQGLVGRASVGYQLFPLAAASEVYFDKGKKTERKDI